ncbi:lipopolysaccharide biosynthesis protein [Agathobacter sp. LCP21S3_B2]|uniref:lipopolysaccharide biosynthesis protein n=1 Tax=Agathobacter sp. LCP21S3_B2 TaxID=3438734 RepID=UPI003F923FA7
MKLERTKNSIRNLIWGVLNKIVGILFPFFLRTVFIYSLGANYLGLNSLFTSILTVLNLAELGFSSAIVYNMYNPIAKNDTDTICALMNYYKKIYHKIGIFVSVVGILLLPFLKFLINGKYPSDINLQLLYIFFLFNTAISYFMYAYKNCILTAYQREDIISKINIVLKIIMYLMQTITLIVLKNYYGYVVCMIINTVLTNIITAYYSEKYYPQFQPKGKLKAENKKLISKNIQGLMVGKLCMVSRNSFDNIFLSMFLGLNVVTIYGNYYYIMNAISGVLVILMSSIGAGIGNSVATESIKKNYKDFTKFTFMYSWIAGWCTVCLFCLYQPFMKIWMGEDLLFPMLDVCLICLYFYSLTMGDVRSQYSAATGLFWQNRYYVLTEAVTNIILNFILGKLYGVHGIILATWISIFFINFMWGSSIIFRYYFIKFDKIIYYKKQLYYFFVVIVVSCLTYFCTSFIEGNKYIVLIVNAIICLILPNFLFFIFYNQLTEYKESKQFVFHNILPKIFYKRKE